MFFDIFAFSKFNFFIKLINKKSNLDKKIAKMMKSDHFVTEIHIIILYYFAKKVFHPKKWQAAVESGEISFDGTETISDVSAYSAVTFWGLKIFCAFFVFSTKYDVKK